MTAGLVTVVSLNLVALLGYPLWVRHQASSSTPLDARITTSELDCISYDGVTHCSVQLRAEYDVDGTTYATKLVPAHGIEARPDLSPLDDPHGCVEALPVGSAITVFVVRISIRIVGIDDRARSIAPTVPRRFSMRLTMID